MFPPTNPSSQLGQLESEIRNLKSEIRRKADDHQINTINNRLDSLERSLGEICSQVDGLLFKVQELEEKITKINYTISN